MCHSLNLQPSTLPLWQATAQEDRSDVRNDQRSDFQGILAAKKSSTSTALE